jgi:hypothetical protein
LEVEEGRGGRREGGGGGNEDEDDQWSRGGRRSTGCTFSLMPAPCPKHHEFPNKENGLKLFFFKKIPSIVDAILVVVSKTGRYGHSMVIKLIRRTHPYINQDCLTLKSMTFNH